MAPFTNYLKSVLGENKQARQSLRYLKSFHLASDQLLDIIYQYGKILKLNEGELLIKEGDFDQWIFLILQGSLSVYVQDQKFDKISSTLVGERCILGEPRRASLKADETVVAFGIDMAMTDILRSDVTSATSVEAFNELLLILIEEVMDRVLHLWFIQQASIDINDENLQFFGKQQIINDLINENFSNSPGIIAFIWSYIKSSDKIEPRHYWNAQNQCLNTRRLVLYYLKNNNFSEVEKLANKILDWGLKNSIFKSINSIPETVVTYNQIISSFKKVLVKHLADSPVLTSINHYLDNIFSVDIKSKVKFSQLEKFLTKNMVPFTTVSDLWLGFIENALQLNQLLNNNLSIMNSTLNVQGEVRNIDVLKNNYQRLIDSQEFEFLEKNLITPYLNLLSNQKTSEQLDSSSKTPLKDSKNFDPSNFDALVKQIGAIAGVAMDEK